MRVRSLLATALALVALAAFPQQGPSTRDHILEAQRHAGEGRWREAERILKVALAQYPSDASLHYNLGHVLETLGDRPGAIGCYERALAIEPALTVASVNLVVMLLAESRFHQAETTLRRALSHAPQDGSLHYHLALALFLRTENVTEPAVEALETARRLGYERPHLYALLARSARVHGEPERATELIRRGLALDPQDALLVHEMGLALTALGHTDAAIMWLEKAIEREPANLEHAVDLARIYLRRGQAEKAARLAEKALLSHTDEPSLLYVLGRARQALGDPRAQETLRRFEKVRKKDKRP